MGKFASGVPVRVGLIGVGSWAQYGHIPALQSLQAFKITAISSRKKARAEEVAHAFDIPNAFDDPRQLVEDKEVDLVVASTKGAATYGDAMAAGLDATDGMSSAILDHGDDCAATAKGKTISAKQASCAANGLWLKALGSSGKTDSGLASGYRTIEGGMIGGMGHRFGEDAELGVTMGWTTATTHSTDVASGSRTNLYATGLYGHKQFGLLRLDADAFYTFSQSTFNRDTQGAGMATAKSNGYGVGAAVRASAHLLGDNLVPLAELRFADQHSGSAAESGVGGLDFTMDPQTRKSLKALAGTRLQHTFLFGDSEVTPRIEAAVEQELGQAARVASGHLTSVANTNFAQAAVAPARTAGVTKVGVSFKLKDGLELYGDAGGRLSANQEEVTADCGLRLHF